MAGAPSDFTPPPDLIEIRDAWRRVQMRQLFRLSLEALLHWTIIKLDGLTLTSEALVAAFVAEVPAAANVTSGEWLKGMVPDSAGPTELMERLQDALAAKKTGGHCAGHQRGFSLSEDQGTDARSERTDRLPLLRARHEAAAHQSSPAPEFIRHILESWVLAQHAYWSVGRGLADARAGGKTLLRLRVVLDEGGWTLTSLKRGRPPVPTPDRLRTMMSLMKECRLLGEHVP
jgi:hypothetical protein